MGFLRLFLACIIVLWHSPIGIVPRILHPGLAVQCFYAISGFLIQLSINRYKNETNKHWYFNFYISRFLRIFPLYWLCAVLTFIFFDTLNISGYNPKEIAIFLLNNALIVGQDILRLFSYDFMEKSFSLLPAYAENMTYIQSQQITFGNSYFTIMGQSWTLAVEIWFYFVAPFVLFRSNIILVGVITASMVGRFIFAYYGYTHHTFLDGIILNEIGIFLCGALSARFYKHFLENHKSDNLKKVGFFVLPIMIAYYCYIWRAFPGGAWGQGMFNVPYKYWSVIAATILMLPWIFHSFQEIRWDRMLGDLSYPVYISHLLVMNALKEMHMPSHLIFVYALPTIIGVATVIIYTIERPIDNWRHQYIRN